MSDQPALESYARLREKILAFRDERDWKQFHDPKNLSEAISIEAAELLELFLWKDSAESRQIDIAKKDMAAEEAADILVFLILLSAELGFDLLASAAQKLLKNADKYPASKARGKSDKYTEL